MKINKFLPFIFLAAAFLLYVLTIKGVPGNPAPSDFKNKLDQNTQPFELSPERGRFALTMSLVTNHSFNIGRTLAEAVYPDVGIYQNRYYIFFAPGISIMAVPLYILGSIFGLSQVFTFFLSAIFALGSGVFIFLVARRIFKIPVWAALFGSLTFCFGSTAWPYAVTLYQHQATTFFILSAFYCAWKYKEDSRYAWLYAAWVWAAAGLAVAVDYPNVLFFVPVLIYLCFSGFRFKKTRNKIFFSLRKSLVISSLVFLVINLAHGYLNFTQYGSFTRLAGSLPDYVRAGDRKPEEANAGKDKNVAGFFAESQFITGLYTLTLSPDRGVLLYSPIFAIGFIGLFLIYKHRPGWESATLLATVIVMCFLYSSWGDPWGGWAFGPRYLIPVFGILSICVAYFLDYVKKIPARVVTMLLFIYSSAVALLGVLTTNAVPPRSEAVVLHTEYNFLHNWAFFTDDRSSSFVYNTWFAHWHLWQYALPIFLVIAAGAATLLFILPEDKELYDN